MKLKGWVLAIAFAAAALPLTKTGHPTGKTNAALFDGSSPIHTWFEGNMPVPPWRAHA